ncbi:hypothetical protein BZG01_20775 [Labilibaculum manganireducens]|uniref:Uncharacterized protein n=1 Tax=Labilibaculum manganireducens TaxID=1940525 RepID=A0A2N3HRC0_9BACT|nr:hypothetical protein BZG01_20775 [Labilibaculum manganireducens]
MINLYSFLFYCYFDKAIEVPAPFFVLILPSSIQNKKCSFFLQNNSIMCSNKKMHLLPKQSNNGIEIAFAILSDYFKTKNKRTYGDSF